MKLNKSAFLKASIGTILLILLVFAGSRKLQNFDAALITYLFGAVFAFFGLIYRNVVWLQRPPTKMYFNRSWEILFSRHFFSYLALTLKKSVLNIGFQAFIYPRGNKKWLGHFLMAFGCTMAFAVTFPLTFGWIHFTMNGATSIDPSMTSFYEAHVFGFKVMEFKLHSFAAFMIFNILSWCSWLVIIGVLIFMRRRFINAGNIAIQTFDGDWLPLILLLAISITGLGLTYSYEFMKGLGFDFMAVLHAITVIMFLIWMPFGKFSHIIQRPAQIGVYLYRKEGERRGMAKCPQTGKEFASQMHVDDLKTVTKELGIDLSLGNGKSHLDYSPEGKRDALALAHLKAREESGKFFG